MTLKTQQLKLWKSIVKAYSFQLFISTPEEIQLKS